MWIGTLLAYSHSWICFGLGRPVSLSASEICTPDPTEQPFLSALAEFARIINKAAQNIYGKRHDSLLPMWKCAREIRSDLQTFARRIAGVMKFGLDSSAKSGEVGICQCILMTCKSLRLVKVLAMLTDGSVSLYPSVDLSAIPRVSCAMAARIEARAG